MVWVLPTAEEGKLQENIFLEEDVNLKVHKPDTAEGLTEAARHGVHCLLPPPLKVFTNCLSQSCLNQTHADLLGGALNGQGSPGEAGLGLSGTPLFQIISNCKMDAI